MNERLARNKTLATHAAMLTAGAAANDILIKLLKPKLPMAARGYAETAIAKVLMANGISMLAETYFDRETQKTRFKVIDAMIVAAYQQVFADLKIGEVLEKFFDSKEVGKLGEILDAAGK